MSRHSPFSALLLAGAVMLHASAARALTDHDHIEKWCTHTSAVAAGRCIGYLLAVEDVLARDSIEGVRACLPRGITLAEQHQIVLDWLKAHPQIEAGSAAGLVARAYAAKYPCEKQVP